MEDPLIALGNCETKARELIAEGKLHELEQPLRQWEMLLKEMNPEQKQTAEYSYFCVVFHQINSALYQNAGRLEGMRKHALEGKAAADQLMERLPMFLPSGNCGDKEKLMALNCAEFARVASLTLENIDHDDSLALLRQAVRLYDWLWPELKEGPSILAVEVHLKLAFSLLSRRTKKAHRMSVPLLRISFFSFMREPAIRFIRKKHGLYRNQILLEGKENYGRFDSHFYRLPWFRDYE